MAPSPLHLKASRHARSISLLSRSHPLTLQVEGQLDRLRASSEATSSSMCFNLDGLRNLHEGVNDLLHLPSTQQTLAQELGEKWVDEVLDGSLRSLDVCGTARDVLSLMKECVIELQSSLRRIRAESGVSNEVESYKMSRKKVTKVISKCLADLRKVQKQRALSSLLDKNHDILAMVSVLREVEAITLSIFESLLLFVSGSKPVSKSKSWSFVFKLPNKKNVTEDEAQMKQCEFEKPNVALGDLLDHKSHKGFELRHVKAQKRLETLVLSIQDLEDGMECVFRNLIKTRVTLLNILNH